MTRARSHACILVREYVYMYSFKEKAKPIVAAAAAVAAATKEENLTRETVVHRLIRSGVGTRKRKSKGKKKA